MSSVNSNDFFPSVARRRHVIQRLPEERKAFISFDRTYAQAIVQRFEQMEKSDDPYKEGYLWFPPHGVLSQLKVPIDYSFTH